ncbi:MAG TPA: Crp/Fnr family transcriptional regulator [Verrucomicrobiae bacterium]|nr:Crp/Fnr family transcriptional regulator [Verrucomicrobiae bacterium]
MATILQNPVIAPMLERARIRTYAKGQTILYPDDRSPDLFLIKDGAVSMHDIDDEGSRKVLHIFGPLALFPMVSFSTSLAPSAWFYTALADTDVYLLSYAEVKEQLENANGVSAYNLFLKQSLDEIHELLVRLNSATKTTSLGKLIAALKFLGTHHIKARSGTWQPVRFAVPHQLLADMTGLTRETVSVTMKQLYDDKIARYPASGKLELNCTKLFKV